SIKKDRDGKPLEEPKEKPAEAKSKKSAAVEGQIDESSSGARLLTFKSRDGVTLYGAYYPPRNLKPGQKAPLLVQLYGGPGVQTVTNSYMMGNDGSAASYNAKGIAVWKMDNRGSSRRGKEFEAAVFRNMGDLEVKDQVDGVRHVARLFLEVDASRVGITGASYGGYMTLRALTEAPETFHVGVSFAPVTDWDGYDTCYTERYMETPQTNPEGYKNSSVINHADRIKGKLLLIHGMIDENVHYRHTARLVQALMAAGKPFELLAVPEGRHGFRRMADATFARNKTVQFFETHLLGESSAARPAPAVNAAQSQR
ncbi:MAG: alpha/beta hydrolase family protein, partial [bacterium]